MRFVALAMIMLSLPLFVAWLQSSARNRDHALLLLGLLVFVTGTLSLDAALVTWPLWAGTSRGMSISVGDMLAIALLFTRKRTKGSLPFLWLLGGYLAVLALSMAHSRLAMASFFSVWDFGRAILLFLAVAGEMSRGSAFPALLRGLSLGLMLQAGYVIEQKLSGTVQATGTLVHQNLLGVMTIVVILPLLAAMLEGERHWLLKAGMISGLIIVAGGGSRGALAVMGGALALLLIVSLIRRQTSHKYAIAGVATLMLLVAAPFAFMTLQDRFQGHSMMAQEEQRAAMEKAARAIIADNPVGVGANLYTNVSNVEGYATRAGLAWQRANRAVPVHNAYLLTRAEIGIQGLIVFVALLGVPIVAGLVHAFRNRRTRADGWVLGGVAALGAIAVQSNFEFSVADHVVKVPMMMCLALIAGRIRASRLERDNPQGVRPAPPPKPVTDSAAIPALPRIPHRGRMR